MGVARHGEAWRGSARLGLAWEPMAHFRKGISMLQTVMQGKPTEREVKRLLEVFHGLKEGEIALHDQLLATIDETRRGTRYYQIVCRAKRQFSDDVGIHLANIIGQGYRHPTGKEQLDRSVSDSRRHVRGLGRATRVAFDIKDERLSELDRRKRDHVVGRCMYLVELAKTEHKALVAELKATPALPK